MTDNVVRSTTTPFAIDDSEEIAIAIEHVWSQLNRLSTELYELKLRVNALRKLNNSQRREP